MCTRFSFETATKQPAPAKWQAKEVWVCGACNKIHHAVQEEHTVVRGPYNMNGLLSASGRTTGIHVLRWSVGPERRIVETYEYHPYPRKIEMSHPEPLLYSLWELLQSKMQIIMNPPVLGRDDTQPWMEAKQQARGIAEALAILMKPFIDNADDVARHAARYYKDNTYEVPGLGTHLWDLFTNTDGTPRTVVAEPKTPAPARRMLGKKLTADEATAVKQALVTGMFTVPQLAELYKVSASEIEAQK